MQDIGIDARAVITDTEAEILRIRELNSQLRGVRVYAGVADGLIPDAIYLVTDDGMHLVNLPRHLKRDFHWTMNSALIKLPPEVVRKIIHFCGCSMKRVQRG